MSFRIRVVALVGILTLAAVLRFTGLSAGLRHTPFIDEQFFVVNVEGMLDRGDLDPRFHMYPGFFFYILTPLLAFVDRPFGADAYLAARGVVAAFGVATVALVYLLGVRCGSVRAGLFGAALLAVSPVAVTVAHEVRPDVVLGFFAMVALLAITRLDGSRKRDAWGGLAVGMGTAIKFTGVTLAVPYVLRRVTFPRGRALGMLLAGAVSLATYAALSPYSFLHFDDFVEGVALQKSYHDEIRARGPQSYATIALVYARDVLPSELGAPALLAVICGLWFRRRDWRVLFPLLALPLALIAVLSTAEIQRARYILSGMGALAVLAGIGVDELWKRSRGLALAAALVVLAVPLVPTAEAVAAYRRPGTLDRVLDWTEANAPEGSRVATVLTQLGLDRRRFELVPIEGWTPQGWTDEGRRTIAGADLVIAALTEDRAPFPRFVRRFVAEPVHPLEGPPLEVLSRVAEEETTRVDLSGVRLDASENTDRLSLIVDGDLATRWETRETQADGMWVEITLPARRLIDSVELRLGERPNQWGRRLEIAVREDGPDWTPVKTVSGRAMVPDQVPGDRGYSQLLLLVRPAPATAIRLGLIDQGQPRWGFAEIVIRAADIVS